MSRVKWVGVLMLAFLVLVALFQIETTKAFITHQDIGNVFQINLGTLLDPFQLFFGHLPLLQAEGIFVGWTVEIIYIVSALEHNRWSASVKAGNTKMAGLFELGIIAATVFNGWTDYNYFGGDMLSKIVISVLIFFVSYYFGHALNFFAGPTVTKG
jgi:hypothetical protein